MKKLKDIIKESFVWEREFGQPLPTIEDTTRMGKFVDAVKEANLNKMKRIAVLFAVVKALGISKQELQQYIQRIKREV